GGRRPFSPYRRRAFCESRDAEANSPIDIRFSMSFNTMEVAPGEESSDTVAQDADALDLELDDIPGLQPATVAVLEDAAGPNGSGAENVSRPEVRVPCRVRHDRVPRVVHVRQIPARALITVHARAHRPARAVELVRGHEQRPDARGEVLPLRRAEPDLHLGPLEIACG